MILSVNFREVRSVLWFGHQIITKPFSPFLHEDIEMKRMTLRGAFLGLALACAAPGLQAETIDIADNLAVGSDNGVAYIDEHSWWGEQFRTDSTHYKLTSITARLGRSSVDLTGSYNFLIYQSDGGFGTKPGTLVATAYTGDVSALSTTPLDITAAINVLLEPDLKYYLVINATTNNPSPPGFPIGSVSWQETDTNSGTGSPFVTVFNNSGGDPLEWSEPSSNTVLRMQIQASIADQQALPEPTDTALFGIGMLGMVLINRCRAA